MRCLVSFVTVHPIYPLDQAVRQGNLFYGSTVLTIENLDGDVNESLRTLLQAKYFPEAAGILAYTIVSLTFLDGQPTEHLTPDRDPAVSTELAEE